MLHSQLVDPPSFKAVNRAGLIAPEPVWVAERRAKEESVSFVSEAEAYVDRYGGGMRSLTAIINGRLRLSPDHRLDSQAYHLLRFSFLTIRYSIHTPGTARSLLLFRAA